MFSLTIVDHIRLDSDHVAQNYMVHARGAERLVAAAFGFRIVIVSLLALAVAANIANFVFPTHQYQIAAIAAAALALIAFAVYAVAGLEARVTAHRLFAHRLWIVAERFRSLVAEVNDGIVDGGSLMRRRDDLIHELHTVYAFGFGVDHWGYESVRLPALPADRAA
jgi:Na+-transporting NADH:ubiquinone oxidoreductase subunit NqrE